MKVNWINSWKRGNKKQKLHIAVRVGRIIVLDLHYKPGKEFRFLIFNYGVQS